MSGRVIRVSLTGPSQNGISGILFRPEIAVFGRYFDLSHMRRFGTLFRGRSFRMMRLSHSAWRDH
jgi:hypothetical protein